MLVGVLRVHHVHALIDALFIRALDGVGIRAVEPGSARAMAQGPQRPGPTRREPKATEESRSKQLGRGSDLDRGQVQPSSQVPRGRQRDRF